MVFCDFFFTDRKHLVGLLDKNFDVKFLKALFSKALKKLLCFKLRFSYTLVCVKKPDTMLKHFGYK